MHRALGNLVSRPFSSVSVSAPVTAAALPATIRAAVINGPKLPLQIERLKMPVPQENDVLIKVRACGVCHSDLHVVRGHSALPFPIILGHEISGEVVAYGPEVDRASKQRLKIGTKVVSTFIMPCGSCEQCVQGKEELCSVFHACRPKGLLFNERPRFFRPDNTPVFTFCMGGLAEYTVVPSTAVFALPAELSHTDAAIMGCAALTAYGALCHSGELQLGESVAVFGGGGGVGTQVLQFARALGANRIIAVDKGEKRLEPLHALGATDIIDAGKETSQGVSQRIRDLTAGKGVDLTIDLSGQPNSMRQCTESVVDGGRCVIVGLAPIGVEGQVEITRLVRRQLRLIGSFGGRVRRDVPAMLALAKKGNIDISAGITTRYYSLEDAQRAYAALDKGEITGRSIIQFDH